MKKDSIIYPIVFMTILAAVFTLILAILNESTIAMVEENQNLDLQRKILYIFNMYDESTSDETVIKTFNDQIKVTENSNQEKIYSLVENDDVKAIAIPFSGPGLWGSIKGYIGLTSDLSQITGIEFIEQNETPGLGGRIGESPYKEQYRGVEIDPSSQMNVINRPANGGNIDAVSGATQTSDFVQNMVNNGLNKYFEEFGQGGK
ncbi:MAG: FMN-binding protein [Tissierellia bacterium]|nr:FMN-binding protein [Tissierellia bacterium]